MNKITRYRISFVILSVPLFLVSSSFAGWEKDTPLSEVPERVLKAARAVILGFEPLEAELERKLNGRVVYEIEGVSSADGESYELEITKKGKVLKIEKGDSDYLSGGDKDEKDDDDDGESE